ncbi:MAG: glycerophosphodiester phosphodiesterase family protein [Cyclobacteriaceae bacterium]|nr:glycerophosphodiester phosphodiesterase family protein [Cyclobacteriaceae bacterium]
MNRFLSALLPIILLTMACTTHTKTIFDQLVKRNVDLQGHRGARGLMPENSIPGFLHALDLGVTTLEMDVGITHDKKVIVSHDPFFSPEICLDPEGKTIAEERAYMYNLYLMDYDSIIHYDCGLKIHPRFPDQKKIAAIKPLLSDVFRAVEGRISECELRPVNYNIEIKSLADADYIYHPTPAVFSDMVYREIEGKIDWGRITIQSFDFRILQYFHEKYPEVRLALLIENDIPWQDNLDSLGFIPPIYSPDFSLLTKEIVEALHFQDMKVIPWTVNNPAEMKRMMEWGVDGLITDYPDRAIRQILH